MQNLSTFCIGSLGSDEVGCFMTSNVKGEIERKVSKSHNFPNFDLLGPGDQGV